MISNPTLGPGPIHSPASETELSDSTPAISVQDSNGSRIGAVDATIADANTTPGTGTPAKPRLVSRNPQSEDAPDVLHKVLETDGVPAIISNFLGYAQNPEHGGDMTAWARHTLQDGKVTGSNGIPEGAKWGADVRLQIGDPVYIRERDGSPDQPLLGTGIGIRTYSAIFDCAPVHEFLTRDDTLNPSLMKDASVVKELDDGQSRIYRIPADAKHVEIGTVAKGGLPLVPLDTPQGLQQALADHRGAVAAYEDAKGSLLLYSMGTLEKTTESLEVFQADLHYRHAYVPGFDTTSKFVSMPVPNNHKLFLNPLDNVDRRDAPRQWETAAFGDKLWVAKRQVICLGQSRSDPELEKPDLLHVCVPHDSLVDHGDVVTYYAPLREISFWHSEYTFRQLKDKLEPGDMWLYPRGLPLSDALAQELSGKKVFVCTVQIPTVSKPQQLTGLVSVVDLELPPGVELRATTTTTTAGVLCWATAEVPGLEHCRLRGGTSEDGEKFQYVMPLGVLRPAV